MPSPLTRKLQLGVTLDRPDAEALDSLAGRGTSFGIREPVLFEGDRCRSFYVLNSGWACRFKTLPGVSRQIIGFLVPGDHIWIDPMFSLEIDYGVCTLTRCEITETPSQNLEALMQSQPAVGRALRWASLLDEAILRQWLLGLGRRPAEKRVAHLFCELLVRLQRIGLAEASAFALPLSQASLGDALGLSPAHVNRSLQSLRARQLLTFEKGLVNIVSLERLHKFAGFSSAYLQPGVVDGREPAA